MPSDSSHAASGSVRRPEAPDPFLYAPSSMHDEVEQDDGTSDETNSAIRGGTSADLHPDHACHLLVHLRLACDDARHAALSNRVCLRRCHTLPRNGGPPASEC